MQERTVSLEWRVLALGGESKIPEGIIPIDSSKFDFVRRSLTEKGYLRPEHIDAEKRYAHHSTRGLYICINESTRSIKAIAFGDSALSQVADDFNLPLYRQS